MRRSGSASRPAAGCVRHRRRASRSSPSLQDDHDATGLDDRAPTFGDQLQYTGQVRLGANRNGDRLGGLQAPHAPAPALLARVGGVSSRACSIAIAAHAASSRGGLLVARRRTRRLACRSGRGCPKRAARSGSAPRETSASAGCPAGKPKEPGCALKSDSPQRLRDRSISRPRIPRPRGRAPIARSSSSDEPAGEKTIEFAAIRIQHAERRVTRAGDLTRGLEQAVEQRLEIELGDQPRADLHQATQPRRVERVVHATSWSVLGRGEADRGATPAQRFTGYAVDSRSRVTEGAGSGYPRAARRKPCESGEIRRAAARSTAGSPQPVGGAPRSSRWGRGATMNEQRHFGSLF